jgi:hypothetical protein
MPAYVLDDPYVVVSLTWNIFMGFETPWWPRGSSLDATGDEMLEAVNPIGSEAVEPANGGTNSRFGVQGITLDVWGAPLGGVMVKLFRTSDDLKVDQIVSDSFGNYLVSTPYYPDAHYLVMYKVAVPDVFGSSVNTLIGA